MPNSPSRSTLGQRPPSTDLPRRTRPPHLGGGRQRNPKSHQHKRGRGAGQSEGRHLYIPWSAMDLFVPRPLNRPRTAFAYPYEVEVDLSIGSQAGPRHSPFKRGTRGFESHPIDQFRAA